MDTTAFRFVAIGFGEMGQAHLAKLIDVSQAKFIDQAADFENFIENFQLEKGSTVVVGAKVEGMSPMEFGQTLRSVYPDAHLVFVAWNEDEFVPEELKKNGYSKALLLPMDNSFFEDLVQSAGPGSIKKRFKAVKMMDLDPNQNLEFSVYGFMPLNKKYVLLTAQGTLSEKKYQKLKAMVQSTVFVPLEEADKFYEYSAEKLARLSESGRGGQSETERVEQLKQNVQELFHTLLDRHAAADYNSGRDLLEQSHSVVQKFVEKKTNVNVVDQIRNVIDVGSDSYSHAQSVSSLACLLSLALDVGRPEDLAIAGLFHDVGVTGFVVEPTPLTDLKTLSDDERERFIKHPVHSVNLLKNKKVTLTPMISEIIEKHHERVDGQGFPGKLPAHKIPLEAQLLAFADLFEYFMQVRAGEKRLTPLEAVDKIKERGGISIELMLKIRKLFVPQ